MPNEYPQPRPEYWWKCRHCHHQWPLINPFGKKNGTICKMKDCPAVINNNLTPKCDKIYEQDNSI